MLTSSFGLIEFGCRTEKPKSNAVLTAFDLTRRRTRVRRAVRFFRNYALPTNSIIIMLQRIYHPECPTAFFYAKTAK